MASKFTLYSFPGSQWAGVAHLAVAETGLADDMIVVNIDLAAAENFNPEYLKINPNGTVPALTSPTLSEPLTESTDILRYINEIRGGSLVPKDSTTSSKVKAIIDLVHSDDVGTNLILLQARDAQEMESKKNGDWNAFVSNRQAKLDKWRAADPNNAFYTAKSEENNKLYKLYSTTVGIEHESFFKNTDNMYQKFASGVERLEELLVLPYAADTSVTEADFHVVPWLSHALAGAGTIPSDIYNFEVLEKLIQKSVPGFKIGPKIRQWWLTISETDSFKAVFSTLH